MRYLIFIVLLVSSSAFAQYEDYRSYETFSDLDKYERDYGLVFSPSLMYVRVEENNDIDPNIADDRSRNLLLYDVRLGYIFRSGFYFGVLYTGEDYDILGGGTNPIHKRTSLGASFGYVRWGWAFTGTIYPYSKQELSNTTVANYTDGFGYQLDAAYYWRLGNYFSIGPQFIWRSFQYKKAESAATSVNADTQSQHDVFTPMISILINLYRG